jgi:hypothetical protein
MNSKRPGLEKGGEFKEEVKLKKNVHKDKICGSGNF